MKIHILILFLITLFPMAQAQQLAEQELEQQNRSLEKQLEGQKAFSKAAEDKIQDTLQKLQLKKDDLSKINNNEKSFEQEIVTALEEIDELLNARSTRGEKAAYYKCLKDSLARKKVIKDVECLHSHRVKLNRTEKDKINKIKEKISLSPIEVEKLKSSLSDEVNELENLLNTSRASYKFSLDKEEMLKLSIKNIEIKRSEIPLIAKNAHFINCNVSTPAINLEEKLPFPGANFLGPFHGIPRDNQDGLGTCYANTAKNLLVGISQGEDIASFLDLALLYKNSSGDLSKDGLDAGSSCHTLAQVKEHGYCPQKYSALETGERSLAGEGLFQTDSYSYFASNINLLKTFLQGLEEFKSGKSPVKDEILMKSRDIIEKIKANPDIQLPLPVARFPILEEWKLKETYYQNKSYINKPEEEFIGEYHSAYQKFSALYIKALLQGKNLDEIFEVYKNALAPFFNKYNLSKSLIEYKRVFLINANQDFKDSRFKKKLRSSLDFLKEVMDKQNESDDEFIEYCSLASFDLKFLASLNPLIERLRSKKLNSDLLFDQKGKFKSPSELMQLTVAPSCLNKNNRQDIKPFTCQNGYNTVKHIKSSKVSTLEKIKMLREKIVLSLIQGYPLGNIFPTGAGRAHINTIVGLRFNSATKKCEYRIRESQTGTSDWHDEGKIFEKISALTEVRRQK